MMDVDSLSTLPTLGSSMLKSMDPVDLSGQTPETMAQAVSGASDEKKKQLAKDFESVFIGKVFDEVKESIGTLSLDEEEEGISDQVHGLFWFYLAQDVGQKGGFGLWQDIYRSFQDLDKSQPAGKQINKEL